MEYVVFDLEWNQPVSRQSHPYVEIGERLPFEIFQIGAVKLSCEFELVDRFEETVRLRQYKRLHFMVKKLTGADKGTISAGVDFEEAAARFREWCGEDFAFVTWGYDDVPILKQNLAFYQMDTDWCDRWYNLQVIFNGQLDEGKNQRSLEYALDYFGIETGNRLHNALNDAAYTAEVARRLNLKKGFSDYERSIWNMRPQKVAKSKRLGVFHTRKEALSSPKASRFCCPVCGQLLLERTRWKGSAADGGYWAEASCKTHGAFVSRLKFKRCMGGWQVTRVIKNAKKKPEKGSGELPALSAASK